MTGRARPAVDTGDDTAPPLRRAPQAGGGVTNGAELLEALTVAVRRAGFKEIEDLLAGRTNTRYERIREELANVCQAVGPDLERAAKAEAERDEARAMLGELAGAVMRLPYPLTDAVRVALRGAAYKPTNLERVTASAAVSSVQSGEEFQEAFARAAKVRT